MAATAVTAKKSCHLEYVYGIVGDILHEIITIY